MNAAQRRILTLRHQTQIATLGERSAALAASVWLTTAGVDDAAAEQYATLIAPGAAAAKAASVGIASAYYATILGVRTPAIASAAVPATVDTIGPFAVARKALSDGLRFDQALVMGQSVAEASMRNVVISSARQTGDVVAERTGVRIRGWIRRADGGACPWCQDLDGVVFDTSDAGDFGHDRCGCTVEPNVA